MQRGEEGKCCGAGEEVEGRVFDEMGFFARWVGRGRRGGGAETRGGEGYGEVGEGVAEGGEGGEGAFVRLERERCVPAGDVLAEKFAADGCGGVAAES